MLLRVVATGRFLGAVIEPVEEADYKTIKKKSFFFDWNAEKDGMTYKLRANGDRGILGLMSVAYFDEEQRINIRLLAVAKEQVGVGKKIDGIAGNLIAFAARMSSNRYGELAAVSLIPKTALRKHYMDKYGFQPAGRGLFIFGSTLYALLNEYRYDSQPI